MSFTMDTTYVRHRESSLPPSTPTQRTTGGLTPRSSHSSSTFISSNMDGDNKTSLLQDRLREKKAESAKAKKANLERGSELTAANLHTRNGPSSSPSRSVDRRQLSETSSARRAVGAKETQDAVSALHKENFDLKLELYHRRQRQTELEEKLEVVEARLNDQMEMQAINEQLLEQLATRDQAIEEAVVLICELEEKLEILHRETETVRKIEALKAEKLNGSRQGSKDDGDKTPIATEKKKGRLDVLGKADDHTVVRMPSFLSDNNEGTDTLRSLYLPGGLKHQRSVLPEVSEDEFDPSMSPRLSLLSESSFKSVYGNKNTEEGLVEAHSAAVADDFSEDEFLKQAAESTEKWLEDVNDRTETVKPATATRRRSSVRDTNNFMSINDVLQSPLKRLENLERKLAQQKTQPKAVADQLAEIPANNQKLEKPVVIGKFSKPTTASLDVKKATEYMPSSRRDFPPTPDTISTNALHRSGKNSNDTLNPSPKRTSSRAVSGSTLAGSTEQGKPFLDEAAIRNLQRRMFHPDQTQIPPRPRSASETVTSRRDGHGWDTDTQGSTVDYTETVTSNSDRFGSDPFLSRGHQPNALRVTPAPTMFAFSPSDDEDDDLWNRTRQIAHRGTDGLWPNGQSATTTVDTPSTTTSRRHDSSARGRESATRNHNQFQNGNQATKAPAGSQRRSSSQGPSADRRRPSHVNSGTINPEFFSNSAYQPVTGPQEDTTQSQTNPLPNEPEGKHGRFATKILGLGRRSSVNAVPSPTSPSTHRQNAQPSGPASTSTATARLTRPHARSSQIYANLGIDAEGGATPPPIARYPSQRGQGQRSTTSSTAVVSSASRPPNNAYGGTADPDVEQNVNKDASGGRKWFGLSKAVKK